MDDDRVERRAMLVGAAGLLTSLAGCGRLFIRPESTPVPGEDEGPTTRTATATPAPRVTSKPTSTSTATPLPNDIIEVRNRRFSVRPSTLERYTEVDYSLEVENVGRRSIELVEFLVAVRYEHDAFSRVVGTDYPRARFDPEGDESDGDDARPGLQPDEIDPVRGTFRFERDGRAEKSSDDDRFALELSLRRIRYR